MPDSVADPLGSSPLSSPTPADGGYRNGNGASDYNEHYDPRRGGTRY
jgi:hypothetical protein